MILGREATITINGCELSHGQAMAVRVAVSATRTTLSDAGLGDDPNGKLAATLYVARLSEVERMLIGTPAAPETPCFSETFSEKPE